MHLQLSCICQCKDTNFKANHNHIDNNVYQTLVVFANAKILILKLITTINTSTSYFASCICQCKDTNFKANHNQYDCVMLVHVVVFANAKILILKLITTDTYIMEKQKCCICQCKDTNFKANHNRRREYVCR